MTGERPEIEGAAGPARPDARPVYTGRRSRLFGIALSRMILTILTVGIGRFWMITRLRRYYWSSLVIADAPLEYTGRAGEKLIGFLVAVVILAAYLLVVNLGLAFIGLSWFQGNALALQLPFLALVPLIFWARYRARRYILARTRWRGIRFGLAPGAWGYTLRALFWWAATLVTLGFLYPLTQMMLARYTTGRSFYGDLRFEQIGGWGPLLASWLLFWAPLALAIGYVVAAIAGLDFDRIPAGADPFTLMTGVTGGPGFVVLALLWLVFAFIRHRVFSFRYLYSGKVLGGRTRATVTLGVWPVIGIYALALPVIGLGVGLTALIFTVIGFGLLAGGAPPADLFAALSEGEVPTLSGLIALALSGLAYLPAVAVFSALGHAFISHPLIAATTASARFHDLAAAGRARQRSHDEQAEAGGFADALGADVGGAF